MTVSAARPAFSAVELNELVIPPLVCPIPVETSPHADVAEAGARVYVTSRGLVTNDAQRRRHSSAQLGFLMGSTNPGASREDLQLVTEWISVNLVLDDVFDRTQTGHDVLAVERWRAAVVGRLVGEDAAPTSFDAHPVIAAYEDLWQRTAHRMSSLWRNRFVSHIDGFLGVCAWEAENRATDRVPGWDEYLMMRRRALRPYLDLAEVTTHVELPPEVVTTLATLHDVVSDVDLWTNDLFSFVQEAERGDRHNLVTVYAMAHGCAPATAMRDVAALVQNRFDDAHVLLHQFGKAGVPGLRSAESSAHLRAMRGWVAGQLAWRYRTRRFDPQGGCR